ncbi:hypothetical protein PIB30_071436, partial [Stylosanthes scabra]|nr:hypothetical protein [Stylosanthes scabra]
MVGFHSVEFDTALGEFETDVRKVFPGVGEGLLDFLIQQKLMDRDVSMCPQCNSVFDAEAAEIFEKEKMRKELARREELVRQYTASRRPMEPIPHGPQRNLAAIREQAAYEARCQARRVSR